MSLTSHLTLARVFRQAAREYEAKANFDPNQPRVPRGSPQGGEWTRMGLPKGERPKEISDVALLLTPEQREGLDVGMRAQTREVQQFMARNRTSIVRALGILQMAGGTAEMVGGVAGVTGGIATTEFGFGIAIATASAWMFTNGYDNFTTGWRALLTGDPQQTNLHTALRQMGLTEDQATATEILLAGVSSATAARMTNAALREAAQRGLERRALAQFAQESLDVRAGAVRIWDEPNIQVRGEAWEAFDAERTGFRRTHPNFRVFDQVDEAFDVAISNKTLDLSRRSYTRTDRHAVFNRLAGYIDRVAAFQTARVENTVIVGRNLRERRLHILLPAGEVLPGQALQIAAAERYAVQEGVILQVEYAR